MAFLKQIKITFGGSFQCRLATDPAPTSSSPTSPTSIPPGAIGSGWTYSYHEPPLDRVIRLANPVSLRNALMEPFNPVKVTQIQFQPQAPFGSFELPWQTIPADPLIGTGVSLGPSAVFDTAAGGGTVTQEAILNLKFSIGTLFTADPMRKVVLDGAQGNNPAWSADYVARKPGLVLSAAPSMDSSRFNVLTTNPAVVANYSVFYGFRCPSKQVPLTNVNYGLGGTSVLAQLLLGWSFYLDLAFYRFDGDTLVGQMDGVLSGLHSDN